MAYRIYQKHVETLKSHTFQCKGSAVKEQLINLNVGVRAKSAPACSSTNGDELAFSISGSLAIPIGEMSAENNGVLG